MSHEAPSSAPRAGGDGAGWRPAEQMRHCLDVICPMHVVVEASGHIRHVGPTLQKLRPDRPLAGLRFFEVFELRHPPDTSHMGDIRAASGVKLRLKFRDAPATSFKGVLVPLPGEEGELINLSFGISLVEAVKDYALTGADFAATDLAIEMLYLVEAKSAAMAASQTLNEQLRIAKLAAEQQAYTDTLTGLKNRRAMDDILQRLIAARRPFALMHIDLDYFKDVNDRLGHAAGDYVLQKVAKLMVEETRSEDIVARVGGDEFVLIFDGVVARERLEAVALRIISELEEPIAFGAELCRVSASGGSVLSGDYAAPEAARMLADADLALYASKHKGRGCHTFFAPEMRAMKELGGVRSAPGETGADAAGPGVAGSVFGGADVSGGDVRGGGVDEGDVRGGGLTGVGEAGQDVAGFDDTGSADAGSDDTGLDNTGLDNTGPDVTGSDGNGADGAGAGGAANAGARGGRSGGGVSEGGVSGAAVSGSALP